ncbi:NUDIX domain-containing protein [Paenibacillus oleatilyticus]|uniref:NUDIX domain-containing protein n=1 Tax=Paenibacillus oleatilyticus TaxID=2594886 RepID=UPI001C1FEF79|nr:NUDIX domain-containing protein [Paenibacillus oleatilyticus]MBU7317109.1 NUDIX domain-containing protein [Paenibacillus oleatilyticus]
MTYPIRVRACALILRDDSVLLIEFTDANGIHYNLPAGGVEAGESVIEAVIREAREEAAADVEVGPLAFVYEYAPHRSDHVYGATHSIHLIFDCKLKEGAVPAMPASPDPNQTGVRWVSLSKLDSIVLYPNLRKQIADYATRRAGTPVFFEEHQLDKYPLPSS